MQLLGRDGDGRPGWLGGGWRLLDLCRLRGLSGRLVLGDGRLWASRLRRPPPFARAEEVGRCHKGARPDDRNEGGQQPLRAGKSGSAYHR
jgi:hypothetical protein